MPTADTESKKSPSGRNTAPSKTTKVADTASTALETAIKTIDLLSSLTDNIPYLSAITGCIQKLIDIRRAMSDNKKRADDLLTNIGEVSQVVGKGLCDLESNRRNAAMEGLGEDLKRYELFLSETCDILRHWNSKSFVKRVWAHGDFAEIADGMDRRLNAFRDMFSVRALVCAFLFPKAMLNHED
ncbi:hypothetical protein K438DRAFT_246701 [Mycena galopus ATCC 62051]|nr:hypothetical protein K438DRAFT_1176761 [Mycena galopus ATCC 62051]KAF8166995.1 hypothetical protein K438DRAFT_246701 [Mycena galopus ATCC 62051]